MNLLRAKKRAVARGLELIVLSETDFQKAKKAGATHFCLRCNEGLVPFAAEVPGMKGLRPVLGHDQDHRGLVLPGVDRSRNAKKWRKAYVPKSAPYMVYITA